MHECRWAGLGRPGRWGQVYGRAWAQSEGKATYLPKTGRRCISVSLSLPYPSPFSSLTRPTLPFIPHIHLPLSPHPLSPRSHALSWHRTLRSAP